MDERIGHLHYRYSIIGGRGSAGTAPMILDRLARERVTESYAEALKQVLGDTATVYVIRKVSAPMLLATKADLADPRLERRWGERLAGAVVRHLAAEDYDSHNVITFADQSDFVAHFIADLLAGVAWERWFYGAFQALRPLSTAEALRRVLLDHRLFLPAVLSRLHRNRTLDKVLAQLDGQAHQTIWEEGLHSLPTPDGEELRPIFAGALQLMDRLNLWTQPQRNGEAMFQEYLATKPLATDWRDRRGLAVSAFEMLSFFAGGGWLRRMSASDEDFLARLDQALTDFDWADVDWLRAALLDLVSGTAAPPADLPLRPARNGATPRQRELLTDLEAALREEALHLDLSTAETAANALRLYAALVARAPRWADDPAATGMIRQTLTAWAFLRQSDSITEITRRLCERDLAGALQTLPTALRANAEPACKILTALGERIRPLLEALAKLDRKFTTSGNAFFAAIAAAGSGPSSRPSLKQTEDIARKTWRLRGEADDETGSETDCAGVALLLRALTDARLHVLVNEVRLPATKSLASFPAVLLALALRWSGERAVTSSQIDPGLSLLAGLPQPPTFAQLREVWSKATAADCWRFQSALFELLIRQRLAETATLHLFRIPTETGHEAVIAGDETALLWPLGGVLAPHRALEQIVADLVNAWAASAGGKPSVIVADDSLAELAAMNLECDELLIVSGTDQSPIAAAHNTGRKALHEALDTLNQCQLDLPYVDLTIALAAAALLRMWARWLRQFAASSLSYLLDNFINRRGSIGISRDALWVMLERRPLDIVLEMAGYTADLERVTWLDGRRVRFSWQRES